MDRRIVSETNRAAWNEVMPIHRKVRKTEYAREFENPDYLSLDDIEIGILKKMNFEGKTVTQLCCNNGRELLSILRLGAGEGVGFDICDEAIREAEELAVLTGLPCRFVRTDVYDIQPEFHDAFDLVYISVGVLPWLPDIKAFFGIASRLLKSAGNIMIYESHPLTNMLGLPGDPEYIPEHPFSLVNSYFRKDPWISHDGIDYIGKSKYAALPHYNFSHSLSHIVNGLIQSDIQITSFYEYPHDVSLLFEAVENRQIAPLSFIMTGTKSSP